MNVLAPVPPSPSLPPALPSLIASAGDRASWRFLEFFTVNIRNKNTRAAYSQAAGAFLRWCEDCGITRIEDVKPVHVAGYIGSWAGSAKRPPSSSTWPAYACCLIGW